ncbi:hypothetical protein BDV35DRAFT_145673 [Aspergillus flavus]|uniref:Uncharacterized protein n=1 Tax=Aspergillus flavus TaxID=5059 RepID=A0A5N6GFW5_ASPFL|nr:hypothetical protein BDV35DRAFT_145673 [Aspergillus flavus]
MKSKRIDLCDILGRQRTYLGDDKIQLQPEHRLFIRQTYFHTFNTSNGSENRRVRSRLCQILRLSSYICILVATSLTHTDIAHLKDFPACLLGIQEWKDLYPITRDQEGRAAAIIADLDEQRQTIIRGRAQDQSTEPS